MFTALCRNSVERGALALQPGVANIQTTTGKFNYTVNASRCSCVLGYKISFNNSLALGFGRRLADLIMHSCPQVSEITETGHSQHLTTQCRCVHVVPDRKIPLPQAILLSFQYEPKTDPFYQALSRESTVAYIRRDVRGRRPLLDRYRGDGVEEKGNPLNGIWLSQKLGDGGKKGKMRTHDFVHAGPARFQSGGKPHSKRLRKEAAETTTMRRGKNQFTSFKMQRFLGWTFLDFV
ncbi:hypothetical protein C8R43DRAFT_965422 [Mycena crocata]|nr:hypothetical protein C8R43DRAFT_965422 [Mycena crocata]